MSFLTLLWCILLGILLAFVIYFVCEYFYEEYFENKNNKIAHKKEEQKNKKFKIYVKTKNKKTFVFDVISNDIDTFCNILIKEYKQNNYICLIDINGTIRFVNNIISLKIEEV